VVKVLEEKVVEEEKGKELYKERKDKHNILYYSQLVLMTLV